MKVSTGSIVTKKDSVAKKKDLKVLLARQAKEMVQWEAQDQEKDKGVVLPPKKLKKNRKKAATTVTKQAGIREPPKTPATEETGTPLDEKKKKQKKKKKKKNLVTPDFTSSEGTTATRESMNTPSASEKKKTFIPSLTYQGKKEGYVFTTRSKKCGYYSMDNAGTTKRKQPDSMNDDRSEEGDLAKGKISSEVPFFFGPAPSFREKDKRLGPVVSPSAFFKEPCNKLDQAVLHAGSSDVLPVPPQHVFILTSDSRGNGRSIVEVVGCFRQWSGLVAKVEGMMAMKPVQLFNQFQFADDVTKTTFKMEKEHTSTHSVEVAKVVSQDEYSDNYSFELKVCRMLLD